MTYAPSSALSTFLGADMRPSILIAPSMSQMSNRTTDCIKLSCEDQEGRAQEKDLLEIFLFLTVCSFPPESGNRRDYCFSDSQRVH